MVGARLEGVNYDDEEDERTENNGVAVSYRICEELVPAYSGQNFVPNQPESR